MIRNMTSTGARPSGRQCVLLCLNANYRKTEKCYGNFFLFPLGRFPFLSCFEKIFPTYLTKFSMSVSILGHSMHKLNEVQ